MCRPRRRTWRLDRTYTGQSAIRLATAHPTDALQPPYPAEVDVLARWRHQNGDGTTLFDHADRARMPTMSTTASETLLNHWIGGRRDERAGRAPRRGERPRHRRDRRPRARSRRAADVDRAVQAATDGRARSGAPPSLTKRAQVLFALPRARQRPQGRAGRADHARARQGARRRRAARSPAASRSSSSPAASATCSRARTRRRSPPASTRTRMRHAARRRRRHHAVQLPRDGAAVDGAGRARVRQRVHPQAVRAGPVAGTACSAELLAEAGLPDGVFSVVHGDKEAVDAILDHPGIAARLASSARRRSRATSTRPARRTASACRRSAAPRTTPSCSPTPTSTSPPTASSPPPTARPASAAWRSPSPSRSATSPSRCSTRSASGSTKLTIGPGTDPASDMGPLVSERHYEKVAGLVDAGVEEGAELRRRRPRPDRRGPRGRLLPRPVRVRPRQARHARLRRGDLRPGAGRRARATATPRRSSSSTPTRTATARRSSPATAAPRGCSSSRRRPA